MANRRDLLFGTRGADVEKLQMMLNRFIDPRPDIKVDGLFGNGTKATVKKFQNQANPLRSRKIIGENLEPDGIVGPQTWKVLDWYEKDDQKGRDRAPGHATLIRNGGRKVPHFRQGDPQWGSIMLGNKSIASKGCAMCSVAMCLAYYGHDINPATLDAYLDANNGYSGNNLYWQKAFDAGQTPGCRKPRLTWPDYRRRSDFIDTIMERLWKNLPTLIGVDYGTSGDGLEDHWVVAVGYNQKDIIINDPAISSGNGAENPNQEITHLYDSRRRGGLTPVRLCLFVV
ncbi:peptidoglycan-binding protein [Novipirellula artificiosorum]|uniref:Putative peptidoglycan binding domain protein n=1 Tax=Novipirellula artificiosorum TaxID=2528016 RepID=A0A5C6D498_9BACT|nr:peptidoglycan-binding protein [Novipirellula artificiosorum]TWU32053.1 putative peptidoglycan binding domain protein [Novipirellula artificiosorum]